MRARGAEPYAEVLGYGSTSDAHHMVQPRPDGKEAARAVTVALADAGTSADEIDWVSAHASSTPIGDIAEGRALAAALGTRAATVPVSATKALTGHPLGATGAIEAAMAALAFRDGFVPGSANLEAPEPELDDLLPGLLRQGCEGRFGRVLSTSFGFGGLNAALVLGRLTRNPRVSGAGYPRAMSDLPAWERRFRAPLLAFPAWAADAPDRLVMASTESGAYQLHTWDRVTGERHQVTEDPVGVLEGRPTRDGSGVVWFPTRPAHEIRHVRDRAVRRRTGPEPLIEGLPTGWPEGLAIGRTPLHRRRQHRRGLLDLDGGARWLRSPDPRARGARPARGRLGA